MKPHRRTTIKVEAGQEIRAVSLATDFRLNHGRNHRTTNAKRNGVPSMFNDRDGPRWFLTYGDIDHICVEQRDKADDHG